MSKDETEAPDNDRGYSAASGDKNKFAPPPSCRYAIITCMDPRLDPIKYLGFAKGDAHVIRNAGGRASDDAIRSLIISHKLLGTQEFFVIHHTNCGMALFTNEVMRSLLASSLDTAQLTQTGFRDIGKGPGSRAGENIDWLTIAEQPQALIDDVKRIRNHPLVPRSIPIKGFIYDVHSNKLLEVEGAMAAGRAA